jgi:hypothetical protein
MLLEPQWSCATAWNVAQAQQLQVSMLILIRPPLLINQANGIQQENEPTIHWT